MGKHTVRNWECGGGGGKTRNHGTSANSCFHVESSGRLKEFMEGADIKGVGSLFQYLTTRIVKEDFLRRHRLGICRNFKG